MDRCKLENQDDEKPQTITLFELSTAFEILSIGIKLSLLAFLLELILTVFKNGVQEKDHIVVE